MRRLLGRLRGETVGRIQRALAALSNPLTARVGHMAIILQEEFMQTQQMTNTRSQGINFECCYVSM